MNYYAQGRQTPQLSGILYYSSRWVNQAAGVPRTRSSPCAFEAKKANEILSLTKPSSSKAAQNTAARRPRGTRDGLRRTKSREIA